MVERELRPREVARLLGRSVDHVRRLMKSGAIADPYNLYWSIRAHPGYPTLELRMTDIAPNAQEGAAIAGLARLLVVAALPWNLALWWQWRRLRHVAAGVPRRPDPASQPVVDRVALDEKGAKPVIREPVETAERRRSGLG